MLCRTSSLTVADRMIWVILIFLHSSASIVLMFLAMNWNRKWKINEKKMPNLLSINISLAPCSVFINKRSCPALRFISEIYKQTAEHSFEWKVTNPTDCSCLASLLQLRCWRHRCFVLLSLATKNFADENENKLTVTMSLFIRLI